MTGIDEILHLERKWSIFFISSWRIECSFLEMFSIVKILKTKFSFILLSKFEILKKISLSLLDWMRFCKQILFSRVKIFRENSFFSLDSSLNFSSNYGEKSYFAIWLDFDQQYFAERESIWQRQFCVVEQYSYFSQQRHFGDGILQHTIFILELDVRTPLCGGDNC